MLDIKYFKQIDEELDVQGYKYYPEKQLPDKTLPPALYCKGNYISIGRDMSDNVYYQHYLTRVIEAINREYWNKYYLQADDVGIHFVTYPDLKIEETWILSAHNYSYDTCKEKAIIYIMDHINKNNGK